MRAIFTPENAFRRVDIASEEAYPLSMDTASRAASEVQEVCEEVRFVDSKRRSDTSPLRVALREYLLRYPSVTAARVGPQGDDL